MSLFFPEKTDDLLCIIPANSEVQQSCQRFGGKLHMVGSYYLSGKAAEVDAFLGCNDRTITIDLGLTYFLCLPLFEKLLLNCESFYAGHLVDTKKTLDLFEAYLRGGKEHELLFSVDDFAIIQSQKYGKFVSSNPLLLHFKNLIYGEITEIVFKRVEDSKIIVFLRPRGDILNWVSSADLFAEWIKQITKK